MSCKKQGDCAVGYVCDVVENECVKRRSSRGEVITRGTYESALEPYIPDDAWTKKQGQPGFNKYATEKMRKEGFTKSNKGFSINCSRGLMAYQRTASFLCAPGRIPRLLVVHRTGAGKTLTMIKILDNFYMDPRPKIIIFPKTSVMNNFYGELMSFNNKYKRYVEKKISATDMNRFRKFAETGGLEKDDGVGASMSDILHDIVNVLAMTGEMHNSGQSGYMAAPLRADTYGRAGGTTVTSAGGPTNAVYKMHYDGKNPYSNKIILCDEIHNLVAPSLQVKKRFGTKLQKLGDGLKRSANTVLVGLTATPIVEDRKDGEILKDIIKGEGKKSRNDEGFVSYFNSLPPTIYPITNPNPEEELGIVIRVPLQSNDDKKSPGNLEVYQKKHMELTKGGKLSERTLFRLQTYCNMGSYYTQWKRMSSNDKFNLLNGSIYASKLSYIAKLIATREEKALVLIDRTHGLKAFVEILNALVTADVTDFKKCKKTPSGGCWVYLYDKKGDEDGTAEDKLAVFNSPQNLRGNMMRAIVADTQEFSEGVSFKAVRRLYIVNPALTWALHKQRIGRVLRTCAYDKLPKNERKVMIETYVATCAPIIKTTKSGDILSEKELLTADEALLEVLDEQRQKLETDLTNDFERIAVDRQILNHLID